jgi:hypothetical protein
MRDIIRRLDELEKLKRQRSILTNKISCATKLKMPILSYIPLQIYPQKVSVPKWGYKRGMTVFVYRQYQNNF